MSRLLVFACFLALFVFVLSAAADAASSDYYERLTLTPLPLGSLLASFDFRSNESLADYEAQNFRYFPRSLGQSLQHADTKELHLRFTTGRWDADGWGARPWDGTREGGTGVELWAWIDAATEEEAFSKWTTLTQSLSGLFCASLNFIDSTRTTRPVLTFGSTRSTSNERLPNESLHLLHGVLPGEVVCTENLTPFLKLLPCKGKAGVSSLLDGHKVFDASWQSMSIDVRQIGGKVEITQSIDVVLDVERSKRPRDNPIPRPVPANELVCDESKPYHNSADTCYPRDVTNELSWSLREIFGRPVAGACPLAGGDAVSVCLNVPREQTVMVTDGATESDSNNRCYHLSEQEFDLKLPQQTPFSAGHELLRAERTITGHGAAHGGVRTIFTNPSATEPVTFVYFESLPWFMRPFIHTLKAQVQKSTDNKEQIITDMYYRPGVDRRRGSQLELVMSVPPASTVMLTYDFEKAILRYTEYPPDANRGFNVAPAVIRVLGEIDGNGSPRDIYIRTTSLLLPLPTPDFSMPYNVIILTSTVIALAFGSIYNLLVRRFVGADEVGESRVRALVKKISARVVTVKDRIRGKSQKVE